tara:strand:- start:3397 stop:3582 length:186 start_codon:yes stop_codon:yes gene_type:complete
LGIIQVKITWEKAIHLFFSIERRKYPLSGSRCIFFAGELPFFQGLRSFNDKIFLYSEHEEY